MKVDYESWRIRREKDEEFTEIENNKELADIQATNILSQGLPRHVFNILNQTRTGKEIWDNVELLMKGKKEEMLPNCRREGPGTTMTSEVQDCIPIRISAPPEVTEYMRIFNELDTEYERCVLANKNLKIERKNLLIQNDCLIANCLEKDICSIVLASDIVVPPSSNCLCEELRSNCDREHSKVVELEAETLKKQQMLNESEKRCAFIEMKSTVNIYKIIIDGKSHLSENLQTQINITRMLNVGSTVGSFDKQTLETELTPLKDALISVRIQIDGYKVENVNLKRRNKEAVLKALVDGKTTSGSTSSEKPKVLASGMYTNSSKYVPPPKRANWVKPTPLPKKKTKPATESRKPMPKSHTRNHRILPRKSVNARRGADHNRKLNFVDHNQFVIRSLKYVNTKTPQAKHSVNHTKKVWKATRNHNVHTTKTAWRPIGKVVGSVKPQWKPTGRHFVLYDNCPLTRIMEPC
ncbi:hypothetical protein Tco_0583167 [Tanacetum coccineum]